MVTPTLFKIFKPGNFVWTLDHYGIGQVSSIQFDSCTIRFFKSVNDEAESVYPSANLKPAYLSPQTRAYHCDANGIWSVGRIIDYVCDGPSIWYDVRFPNGRDQRISESDIRVRWLQPVDDPAAVLATGGMESQFLHDKRRAALECLTSARSAGFGLTSLLSASVELAHYQVDVVRRVLNDPIQRYLLADEVGLGKTIEACAIVKQALCDSSTERVVIVVPSPLIGQWKRELSWRFSLGPAEQRLRIIPHKEIHSIDPSTVDTLVVDEAQSIISDNPEVDTAYEALRQISHRAHRLLLISATPVLGNEKAFLALLHLLDPLAYRLDDGDDFVRKLERRQEFGRLLLTIRPDQNPVFLRISLRQLRELVSEDEFVASLVDRIELALDNPNSDSISANVRVLHRHVSDTYRLHQRLIRTRRKDLSNQESLSRMALEPILEEDEDERSPQMVDALDQWRHLSLDALATRPDDLAEPFERDMIQRYQRLHEALGTSVEACGEELESQLRAMESGQVHTFPEDKPALKYALSIMDEPFDTTRVGFAVTVIAGALRKIAATVRLPRIVAFGSSTNFVQSVATQLSMERVAEVFCVTEASNEEDVIVAVDGFFACRGPAVICCDRQGEEGLNMQYAHGIVHLDLPLAPSRIEQRIGRLDRFGRKFLPDRTIHHWVVSPFADYFHPWEAWFKLLRDDFRVFDQSISEVQFLLDNLQQAVVKALYRNGAEGIRNLGPQVRDAVDQERERLDEQYALDSRTLISSAEADAFRAIESKDTYQHYQPLHSWLTEVMHFRDEWLGDSPDTRAFRLYWTPRTLVPRQPWQEMFPDERLAIPMTYERRVASHTRGLRLVRPGLELVDSLETMLRWDDRGTAYATWRLEPEWPGEIRGPWLGFRLTFLVEANMPAAQDILGDVSHSESPISLAGVRRRLDIMLPPWTSELYIDIHMEPVTDSYLLQVLARPYSAQSDESGIRDFNLGSRRNALYETIGFEELLAACSRVRQEAEAQLRASPDFESLVTDKVQQALAELEIDRTSLERRSSAIVEESGGAMSGLEVDILVNSAVATGIASPVVKLDSIGLIVVSNSRPRDNK